METAAHWPRPTRAFASTFPGLYRLLLLLLALTVPLSPLTAGASLTRGVPGNPIARTGDRSVALHWDAPTDTTPTGYHIYRSLSPQGPFVQVDTGGVRLLSYADLAVTNDQTYFYLVRSQDNSGVSDPSSLVVATPRTFENDEEFLELLQATAFDYFWYEANPTNGLIRDRSTLNSFSSIAAVGFGLTGMGIGIDHGWITRAQGRERVFNTLKTFANGPQGPASSGTIGYNGWFYHFLFMNTAQRYPNVELSSIDTALLLGGVIYAREYFDQADPQEAAIREMADLIFNRVDWNWMANNASTLTMGWMPGTGFLSSRWKGYNEGMILYLLGLGAANNPLPAADWDSWTASYKWLTYDGYSYVNFPPLFGHQYSHCWVDFRYAADAYMRDKGISYFENSRRATLAQRAYAARNPSKFPNYGTNLWGWTACDGPGAGVYLGYSARGAPPAENDDGTIAPTAAGGSLAFTPEFSVADLRNLYDTYRTNIWTGYGFRDAFNLKANWWDTDVLGIDQGPILLMAENYRTKAVWNTFMRSPIIQRGLARAGFTPAPFLDPNLQIGPDPGTFKLSWSPTSDRAFQVEYSPNLTNWFLPLSGFFELTNGPIPLSWTDRGPGDTMTYPALARERYYRVFQLGQ